MIILLQYHFPPAAVAKLSVITWAVNESHHSTFEHLKVRYYVKNGKYVL